MKAFRIGEWDVEPDSGLLRGVSGTVRLDPRVMGVLRALSTRAGAVVSKQQLLDDVWSGASVTDDTVTVAIYELRKALGDDAKAPRYVETIPRRGYRLLEEPVAPPRKTTRAVVVVALAAALLWFGLRPSSEPAAPLVAVVPFELHASTGDDDYLASGFAETMTSDLARVDGLSVLAHRSARRAATLAELGVTHIVSGSLVKHDDELRVNVHLSRTGSDTYDWSETYRGDLADFLTLQRQVSVSIAAELDHQLSGSLGARRAVPKEAMKSYLLGRHYWNRRDADSLKKAEAFFERAIELDPRLALAWSGKADLYTFPGPHALGIDRDEGYRRALDASRRARTLDPQLADAYVSTGAVQFVYERDFEKADASFRDALVLAPSHALAHQWYGELLSAAGDHERAIAHMSEAARLDPRSEAVLFDLFWVQYMAGRFANALESLDATIAIDGDDGTVNPLLYWSKARTEARLERMDDALASLDRFYQAAGSARPEEAETLRSRRTSEAFEEFRLAALKKEAERGRPYALSLAGAYASTGEIEPALTWLERAVHEGDAASLWIAVNPDLKALSTEPRFVELVRELGLEPSSLH